MTDEHYLRDELYGLVAQQPEIFEFLQRGSLDGLWYWDLEDPAHEWMNEEFWTLLGYDAAEKQHLASEWQELIHPDDLVVASENLQRHLEDPSHPYDQVVRYRHRDGRTIWVRCRGIAIRDAQGRPVRMLGAHNDLTAAKELEERLRRMASEDPLTGLANRRGFEDHGRWAVANLRRTGEPLSLAIIDLDHFKQVNDTHGHHVGDQVLVACATAIRDTTRQNDVAARWGGEEFIVMLHRADVDGSIELAERLRAAIADVDVVAGGVTASVGTSTFPRDELGTVASQLERRIQAADRALYAAKLAGRDRCMHSRELAVG